MSILDDNLEELADLALPIDGNWLWDIGFVQRFYPGGERSTTFHYKTITLRPTHRGYKVIRQGYVAVVYCSTRKQLLNYLEEVGIQL